jgi:hypothetical protein
MAVSQVGKDASVAIAENAGAKELSSVWAIVKIAGTRPKRFFG